MQTIASQYFSKHERLEMECSKPETKLDCVPGQKWKCEREGHRWRKHKCRLAVIPDSLPKSSRKCACFTPNGVIYTRLDAIDKFNFEDVEGPYGDVTLRRGNIYNCNKSLRALKFMNRN